jgi:hypothetical protein
MAHTEIRVPPDGPFAEEELPLREGRYFQIRGEAQKPSIFCGFGVYNTSIGTGNYGLITTAGNTPRRIQRSARFNF